MNLLATIALVLAATAAMLRLSVVAARAPLRVSRVPYVNTQARYQLSLLGVALGVCGVAGLLAPGNLRDLLAIGDVRAPAGGVPLFGIADGESWMAVGTSLSVFATLATTGVILAPRRALLAGASRIGPHLPWIVLFSLTNSLAEELIFRLGVLVPLFGTAEPSVIVMVSAVLFGAPHLRGMPSGIVGAVMSGVLGWLLARSVLETQGIAWAWWIHFLQDLPIYTAMLLTAVPRDASPHAIGG
jgi:uncharacterized protein